MNASFLHLIPCIRNHLVDYVLSEIFCKIFIKDLQKFSGRMKKGALKLLLALSERERLEDLASRLGIHASTAWRHVKELETAGLVDLENGD